MAKMNKTLLLLLLLLFTLVGCQETEPSPLLIRTQTIPASPQVTVRFKVTPSPTPTLSGEPVPIPTPAPEETDWPHAEMTLQRFYLTTRNTRQLLVIEAILPTPCHQVRYQVQVQGNRLQVEVYTVVVPQDQTCIQVPSFFWGYADLTPWLESMPEAEVWLDNQAVPKQEGLVPLATRPPVTPMTPVPPTFPPQTPQVPQSGETGMQPIPPITPQESGRPQAPFYLESARLDQWNRTWRVLITGSLPTPCHQPRHRMVFQGRKLMIEVFTLPQEGICIQVLKPFQGFIDLSSWAVKAPGAEVWVNGQRVGTLGPEEE